jgi:DNA-binding response OmpR family regulator
VRTTSGVRRAVRERSALIVEDDATIRTALASLLEDDEFEVMTASTLERARYILFESSHPVGVAVIDLGMPDGDGERLVEELCERESKNTPVVLLSADANRVSGLGVRYGLPVIVKPFDVNVAAASVAVAFDNDVRPYLRRSP